MKHIKELAASIFFCLVVSAAVLPLLGSGGCGDQPGGCDGYVDQCCQGVADGTATCSDWAANSGCTCNPQVGDSDPCRALCNNCGGQEMTQECLQQIAQAGCGC